MSNVVLEFPVGELYDDTETVIDDDILALIAQMDTDRPDPANTILVPGDLMDAADPSGLLYGYIRPDSGRHSVLGWGGTEPIPELKTTCIGAVGSRPDWDFDLAIHGVVNEEGKVEFRLITPDETDPGTPLDVNLFYPKQDVFSRHLGLIETDWMDNMTAVLCGCGSVGSCIALHMARSGVGRFILIDADCFEIHNVCRHQCNHTDLGRFKVDAVAERILQINPNAQILKFYRFIQDIPVHKYADWIEPKNTVFVGTCDNRVGNAYACDIAYDFGASFVALGFKPRAWGGEIFIALPERNDICYRCAFKTQVEEAQIEQNRNHLYMDAENPQAANFVPGLDVDVEYGCTIVSKILLDVFNRHNEEYQPRMLHTMGQYTVFSGTADRTAVEPVWKKLLPGALSMRSLPLSEKCRRCAHCTGTEEA